MGAGPKAGVTRAWRRASETKLDTKVWALGPLSQALKVGFNDKSSASLEYGASGGGG